MGPAKPDGRKCLRENVEMSWMVVFRRGWSLLGGNLLHSMEPRPTGLVTWWLHYKQSVLLLIRLISWSHVTFMSSSRVNYITNVTPMLEVTQACARYLSASLLRTKKYPLRFWHCHLLQAHWVFLFMLGLFIGFQKSDMLSTVTVQEAQLSPRDRAMHCVSWNRPMLLLPPVLWHCRSGVRKSIQPVKIEFVVLVWLSVYTKVHMSSWCHWHLKTPSPVASLKSGIVCTFLVVAYPHCPGKKAVLVVLLEYKHYSAYFSKLDAFPGATNQRY